MRVDIGIVGGKALNAIGIHRLFANPLKRLALFLFVGRHVTMPSCVDKYQPLGMLNEIGRYG